MEAVAQPVAARVACRQVAAHAVAPSAAARLSRWQVTTIALHLPHRDGSDSACQSVHARVNAMVSSERR